MKCESYSDSIESGSKAGLLLDRLREAGVADANLDSGYHQIDYYLPGRWGEYVGAGDCLIEDREVVRYAIERWRDYRAEIEERGTLVGPVRPTGLPNWSGYNFVDPNWTWWLGKDRSFWELKTPPVIHDFRPQWSGIGIFTFGEYGIKLHPQIVPIPNPNPSPQ